MSVLMTTPDGSKSNQTEVTWICECGRSADPPAAVLPVLACADGAGGVGCPFATPPTAFRHAPEARLTAQEERELFHELARIRQRLTQLALPHSPLGRSDRGELMRLSCRACSLRRHLAHCHFKLAVSVARAFAARYQDIDDLVGQACVTLMRALDLFDVRRGYRFSTYATRAMRTELSRYIVRRRRAADRAIDPAQLVNQPAESAYRAHPGPAAYCVLEELLDDLEPREADVVRSRFGLHERPGSETLQAVADRLGISRERVRQLEQSALLKLRRRVLQDERAELLDAVP
jgi:RNA polymerase primary sigma factor